MISTAIMAHESRADRFEYLLKELGQDTPLFVDTGKLGEPGNLGPWGNAKRAWRAYGPDCKYHMVVQDDVIFGAGFKRRVHALVKNYQEDYAFSLFANGYSKVVDDDFRAKYGKPRGGIISSELYTAVAVILPTRIINEMIEFADNCTFTGNRGQWFDDDARIGEYLKHIGMKVIYPLPSLVQHHRGMDSLVGYGHNSRRQTRWFV
jgi:hypothetical protein